MIQNIGQYIRVKLWKEWDCKCKGNKTMKHTCGFWGPKRKCEYKKSEVSGLYKSDERCQHSERSTSGKLNWNNEYHHRDVKLWC